MNERIKELAVKANPASKEIYESDNWEYNCAAWCAQDVEKFAKLIVRECAYVSEGYFGFKDNTPGTAIAKEIKQHFGVEE